MMRYRIAVDNYTPTFAITRPLTEALKYPLLFEPGASWEYSVGLDWAGMMVERVSGMDLDAYLKKNIWGPLGVSSITFCPKKDPATFAKLTDMSLRAGGISPFGVAADPEAPVEYTEDRVFSLETPGRSGGAGLYGNPIDYQKLLHSICADDGKILKKETVDYMFQDHLTAAAKAKFNKIIQIPELREAFGGVPAYMEVTYGLGGMIFLKNVEGGRRAGTMNWGGYPNLVWFCDRKAGLSGIVGSQICPLGDAKFNQLVGLWERELYKISGKVKL
jgi:CubicO group peptidase (beta-lactamase class C family)